MERALGPITVEIVSGDIAQQEGIDAIVNAANAQLKPGGGVAGAIHRAAGPSLEKACRPLAPIKPGDAVITPGFNLPNPWVIHCLGPVYGVDNPPQNLLADCYANALKLAEEKGLRSVAFPAVSAGAFGYPMEEAAHVALATILKEAKNLRSIRLVRFVLIDKVSKAVFERTLNELHPGSPS